ncbi:acyl carrier protein [Thermodesulfobacteriota bacterium]
MNSIISDIQQFLLGKELIKSTTELSDSDSLLEHGIIDSVGIQDLVVFLESKYGISIEDDDLMPDNFDSLKAMASFVLEKRG